MNIFVLDMDFKKNAEYHCDKHVVKMQLEHCQILSTVHWLTGSSAKYKATHSSHPCTRWVMESINNYRWLINATLAICEEYTYRYGKVHACEEVCLQLAYNEPNLPNIPMTKFALAMPDNYKHKCAVKSYREYYLGDKQHLFAWEKRNIPDWVKK